MENTQSGQQTESQMKKHESNIRDLWDNIKRADLCIIRIPEGKEKEKEIENIFEEIMAENFPNEIDIMIQEAQRAPNKPTPRYITTKMAKAKAKREWAVREKQRVNYKETPKGYQLTSLQKHYSTEESGKIYSTF